MTETKHSWRLDSSLWLKPLLLLDYIEGHRDILYNIYVQCFIVHGNINYGYKRWHGNHTIGYVSVVGPLYVWFNHGLMVDSLYGKCVDHDLYGRYCLNKRVGDIIYMHNVYDLLKQLRIHSRNVGSCEWAKLDSNTMQWLNKNIDRVIEELERVMLIGQNICFY